MSRLGISIAAASLLLLTACSSSSAPPSTADRADTQTAIDTTPIPASNIPCTDEVFKEALSTAPAGSGIDASGLTVNSVKCVAGWAYADVSTTDAEFEILFTYADDSMEPDHWAFVTSDEPLPVSEMVKEGVPRDVAEQLCPGC
jgi:hypothetical protein